MECSSKLPLMLRQVSTCGAVVQNFTTSVGSVIGSTRKMAATGRVRGYFIQGFDGVYLTMEMLRLYALWGKTLWSSRPPNLHLFCCCCFCFHPLLSVDSMDCCSCCFLACSLSCCFSLPTLLLVTVSSPSHCSKMSISSNASSPLLYPGHGWTLSTEESKLLSMVN